ncbi:OsmC family protein [Serratia liquefaciens]|uniref:OsmC family protein n=1 Tax=Serratia liquefaciens TaxID=614 RepID=UPI00235F6004|nr:OsmC family protein [Serratia liquefaciens]
MAQMNTSINIHWNGAMQGAGRIEGTELGVAIAIPTSFGGSGAGTDPKSLLVSAAASCYAMTLIAMLEAKKLPVAGLAMHCKASESQAAGVGIDYDVRLLLSSDATQDQLDATRPLIKAADTVCAIGNLLRTAGYRIEAQGQVATIVEDIAN